MNILITGGAGFVGSALAIYLKAHLAGSSIVCLDNLKRRGSELNLLKLRQAGVRFIHGDIRNGEDLMAISGADFIIDAAAEPSVLAGITSPIYSVFNNNLTGTIHLLEAAIRLQSNFIFLSTSRVYPISCLNSIDWFEEESRFSISKSQTMRGISENGISEAFPLEGSRSFYGATKYASELFIEEFEAFTGLNAIVNRCGVISGPGQMGKQDQGVAVLWMAQHYWKNRLKYIGYGGGGKQVRDILHIDDLCSLVKLQIENFNILKGQTFNVGGGLANSCSLLEMSQLCAEISGNKISVEADSQDRNADVRIYISDNTKIQSQLAWRPQKSCKHTLQDIYAWIQENETVLREILT